MASGTALLRGRFASVREMEESDAARLAAWRSREEVRRFLYGFDPPTPESQLQWFRRARANGDILLMFDALDGEPVGTVSLYGLDRRLGRTAEWGRLLAARIAERPHSLAEACYLVHRVWFEVLGMRRLVTHMLVANGRSVRMAHFLGYLDEGLRRQHWEHPDGHCEDVIEMGLLAEDFEAAKPTIEKRLYRALPVPDISEDCARAIRSRFAEPIARALRWPALPPS